MQKNRIILSFQFFRYSSYYYGEDKRPKKYLKDLEPISPSILVTQSTGELGKMTLQELKTNSGIGNLSQEIQYNSIVENQGTSKFDFILFKNVNLFSSGYSDSMYSQSSWETPITENAKTFSEDVMSIITRECPSIRHIFMQQLDRDESLTTHQLLGLINSIKAGNFPQDLEQIDILTDTDVDRNWASNAASEIVKFGLLKRDIKLSNFYIEYENARPKINAFLCHATEDKAVVEQFANMMLVKKSRIWFDKWEIKVGDSIVEKISEGLESMTHLIIFLSKSSIEKPWVKKELSSALMRKLSDNSVKVIPIMIDKVKIPLIINDLKYADCSIDLQNGLKQALNDIVDN